MKAELNFKLLQHLARKHQDGGFTLIELLVVIVIIGILSAIALPSFLNQANKARQSEAKTYVGSTNRAQQAYFIEYGQFGTASQLEGGIPATTQNYAYTITFPKASQAAVKAEAQKNALKSYAGLVEILNNQLPGIVCETTATTKFIVLPNDSNTCGAASVPIRQ